MRRGLLCLLTLAAGLPAAVRADPGPPPPPVPPPLIEPASWSPEAAIRDGSARCGACRTTTSRFIVGYERHHGFYLMTEHHPDAIVWIVFANRRVGEQFGHFLSPENLPSLYGKRAYCDCTGRRYTMGDTVIFRTAEARLFAR